MNNIHLQQFQQALARYRGNRLRRLLNAPAHLLYSKALELAARGLGRPIRAQARTFWGGTMTALFPEPVSTTVYRYGFFEEELTHIVLHHVKPGMVFFDIGAHFGYFSLLASALVGERGCVHSFEPTPSTYRTLHQNAAPHPNIHPINAALWSSETTIRFLDYGIQYSAFNSIQDNAVHNNARSAITPVECDVRAITLDDYVRQTNVSPNFIKMDAEGAELAILEGMHRVLRECRPMITVEVGDKPEESESKSRQLLDTLVAQGYRPHEWADGAIVPHQRRDRYDYTNILLLPE